MRSRLKDRIKCIIDLLQPIVPVHIGSTGVTNWKHYTELLAMPEIDAVSVSNVHHMSRVGITSLRDQCKVRGIVLRKL